MKSWGHMKFVNESEIASWNDFKQNIAVTLRNWINDYIFMLNQLINFHVNNLSPPFVLWICSLL